MEGTYDTLMDLLDLEPHGIDAFVGAGPTYHWGDRVYGGQVAAQALYAAAKTVDPEFLPHSLHAYFIRGGASNEPIRYEVDRIRNGRSFATRRVVARQSAGAIFNLSASFQKMEDGADVQTSEIPDVVGPEDLKPDGYTHMFETRSIPVNRYRAAHWAKLTGPLPDDPVISACGLTFVSDDNPMEAITKTHPGRPKDRDPETWPFMGASLDHAVWFHRPAPVNEWMLYDMRPHGMAGGRGVAFGEVFTQSGLHVASIAQEGLVRVRRDRSI